MLIKICLIDNYDSFTYNLYDYLCRLGIECVVFRNDEVPFEELDNFDALVLSPGPQRPELAGYLMDIVRIYADKLPILGVCLGHQALGLYYGAELNKAKVPVHGKTSEIKHFNNDIFYNIENPMQVMRYHSLILDKLPDVLIPLAYTDKGELMAMRHKKLPLWGVQFHPESILTPSGIKLISNWLDQTISFKEQSFTRISSF